LFGHVKGAFTDAKADRAGRFELADESTLFMDEIANIPLAQQAKLLRVIETGDFERVGSSKTLHANVRVISATNANLKDEVAAGRFRQDLLFRLNTVQLPLPPPARPTRGHRPVGKQLSSTTLTPISKAT
jgi:transcriptional regulator with GAF, ATPase, and Fis domain